ncbi:hypothetical protein BH11PSE10_BH11PSE10_12440 [soil metagenome]
MLEPLNKNWRELKDATRQRHRGLNLMVLADCAVRHGDKLAARPQALEAQATFARLAEGLKPNRQLMIYEARALGVMAASAASKAEVAALKQRAEARFAQDDGISPLASDDRREREAVAKIQPAAARSLSFLLIRRPLTPPTACASEASSFGSKPAICSRATRSP